MWNPRGPPSFALDYEEKTTPRKPLASCDRRPRRRPRELHAFRTRLRCRDELVSLRSSESRSCSGSAPTDPGFCSHGPGVPHPLTRGSASTFRFGSHRPKGSTPMDPGFRPHGPGVPLPRIWGSVPTDPGFRSYGSEVLLPWPRGSTPMFAISPRAGSLLRGHI